jgi:transposase
MPIDPDNLPSDVDALRAMLSAQAVEMAEQAAMVAAQRTELAAARAGLLEQRYEIEALRARLAKALRVAFGRSSEKLRDQLEQLELTLADLDETIAATEPKDVEAEPDGTAPSKPARRPLPATLPRDIVEHAAPCNGAGACLECGGTLRQLGEDVTELLDYVPGSFRVIRHVRPKLSCRSCETITQAPAPSLPIRRGRAGPRAGPRAGGQILRSSPAAPASRNLRA